MTVPTTASRATLDHLPSLDGLRAVAVVAVLFYHGSYGHVPGGFLGVDLFFVLSGYLITRILYVEHERRGEIRIGRFYARRIYRLYPALVVGILLAGALRPLTNPEVLGDAHWGRAAVAVLFYFANFVPGVLGNLGHTWSLSIEEQFYLFWPLALGYVVLRRSVKVQAAVVLGIALAAGGLRLWLYQGAGVSAGTLYLLTPTRLDGILIGATVAIWVHTGGSSVAIARRLASRHASGALLAVFAVLMVVADGSDPWLYQGGATAIALAFGIWILTLAHGGADTGTARLLSSRPLRWIGSRSYGIYLFHLPIFLALESARVPDSLANFLLVSAARFGVTGLVAAASFHWIERPILRLRDRGAPRPIAPAAAVLAEEREGG